MRIKYEWVFTIQIIVMVFVENVPGKFYPTGGELYKLIVVIVHLTMHYYINILTMEFAIPFCKVTDNIFINKYAFEIIKPVL